MKGNKTMKKSLFMTRKNTVFHPVEIPYFLIDQMIKNGWYVCKVGKRIRFKISYGSIGSILERKRQLLSDTNEVIGSYSVRQRVID